MTGNRHPADRLADVRESIRELEAVEAKLRTYLHDHPEDRVGDEHEASIVSQNRKRVDVKALAAHFGEAALRPFMSAKAVDAVRLKRRRVSNDGL